MAYRDISIIRTLKILKCYFNSDGTPKMCILWILMSINGPIWELKWNPKSLFCTSRQLCTCLNNQGALLSVGWTKLKTTQSEIYGLRNSKASMKSHRCWLKGPFSPRHILKQTVRSMSLEDLMVLMILGNVRNIPCMKMYGVKSHQ